MNRAHNFINPKIVLKYNMANSFTWGEAESELMHTLVTIS